MQIGVVVPQRELAPDAHEVAAFARGIEALGYGHVLAYDHVLGARLPATSAPRPGWPIPPYTDDDPFHEPFVLLAAIAATTTSLGLGTGILVLPQRPTALVAKQAAQLARLSAGRLRLGVGVGFNDIEYDGLGASFHDRGIRLDAQAEVLRALWSRDVVTRRDPWHTLRDVGINPRPLDEIPLWFGGASDRALQRVARLGHGWMAQFRFRHLREGDGTLDQARDRVELLHRLVREHTNNAPDPGIDVRMDVTAGSPEEWHREAELWRSLGITHLSIVIGRRDGLPTPSADLMWKLTDVATALGVSRGQTANTTPTAGP